MAKNIYLRLFILALVFFSFAVNTNFALANKNSSISNNLKKNSDSSDVKMTEAFKDFSQMKKNLAELDYVMYFTNQNNQVAENFVFSNFYQEKSRYSELKNLEGAKFFIRLNQQGVIYKDYTLRSNAISDFLPNIFNVQIDSLFSNYKIKKTSTTRVADRVADVYEIENKYSNLYSYHIALDRKTKLPLKVTLIDKELGTQNLIVLNSFTVSNLIEKTDLQLLQEIKNTKINSNLKISAKVNNEILQKFNKLVRFSDIPSGFKLTAATEIDLIGHNLIVKNNSERKKEKYYNLNYSDGLFNFTINISEKASNSNNHYFWREADTSLYAETYAEHTIIVAGQIPLSTAKQIASSIYLLKDGKVINRPVIKGYGQRISIK